MKKLFPLCLIILFSIACQQQPKPVDIDAEKAAINEVLDKINDAFNTMDIDSYMSLLDDDGLYCGTDASELMDKTALEKVLLETSADSIIKMDFPLDKRVIRVNPNGLSAIAIEQYLETGTFGPNLPLRAHYHLINNNGDWVVDFLSMSLIPYNEDLGVLIDALKEKK